MSALLPSCDPDSLVEAWTGTLREWYDLDTEIKQLKGKMQGMAQSIAVVGSMLHP
jgi:hypothetical protein